MENGASLVLHVFYPLPKDIPHRTSDGGHPPSRRLSRNFLGTTGEYFLPFLLSRIIAVC